MMGVQAAAPQLFYDFRLDDHVPVDHLLRCVDRFLDLSAIRTALRPYYSSTGPSGSSIPDRPKDGSLGRRPARPRGEDNDLG
jgi:hypothetical protein